MFPNLEYSRVRRQVIIIIVVMVLLVSLAEIWSVNRLATLGVQINKMDVTKSRLQLENQELEVKIAQDSSLNLSEKYAKQLGFKDIANVQYIKDSDLASR